MSPCPIEPAKNSDERFHVVMPSGRKPSGRAIRSGPFPPRCLPFSPPCPAAAGTATASASTAESAMRFRLMVPDLPPVAGFGSGGAGRRVPMPGLSDLHEHVRTHGGCGFEICESATHLVPGEGSETADVMIVGEAPGKSEDEQGRPFVGRSGK